MPGLAHRTHPTEMTKPRNKQLSNKKNSSGKALEYNEGFAEIPAVIETEEG